MSKPKNHLNQVILSGNLIKEVDLRFTPRGKAIAETCVASQKTWKDPEGNEHEETDLVNITFWGKRAEMAAAVLRKGGFVDVEGRLKFEKWNDKSGEKRSALKVEVIHVRYPTELNP